ncbi:putative glycosyltransferase [Iris pallida]|uniref:Glycosyltransferase n=1 Tax=Iris pallida TaxID=29817 RepID=A0AAX6HH91_IRIPA|nr:putative glycosyltransferase [Iris pallida]
MRSSSSWRIWSSSSCWRRWSSCSSSWVVVCVALVPLVLVSLLLFASDSNSTSPWFYSSSDHEGPVVNGTSSSSSSSIPSEDDDHVKYHLDIVVEGQGDDDDDDDGKEVGRSNKSPLLSSSSHVAPSPAPAEPPVGVFFEDSRSGNESISTLKIVRTRDVKLERLENGLAKARAAIREATRNPTGKSLIEDKDYVPQGPIYRNPHAFHRSYMEMEKLFKVYVYGEGEPPLFHEGPCKSIYSMEGRFIYNMEMDNRLRTRDPDRAHVFFLPFSVVKMVKFIYKDKTFDIGPLKRTIVDYINVVSVKYRFWNRSLGADHFMLSCHDWGPHASAATPYLYSNSIRVLCNANTSEGFNPQKDVTLPEINLQTGLTAGIIGGPSPSRRPFLAFFAGGLHGHIRSFLLQHWKDKDEQIQVHQYLPRGMSYYDMMRKSKYCICPSGYEVASPRIVEAIYLECVPVIISDHYVLPFSDVLNWKAFSVQVAVKDIPNLKDILWSISPRQYIRMQRRVKTVQRHFIVSSPPQRFDVFHMILHSIWLRRLNIQIRLQDQ